MQLLGFLLWFFFCLLGGFLVWFFVVVVFFCLFGFLFWDWPAHPSLDPLHFFLGSLGNNCWYITFRTLKSIVQKGSLLCSGPSTSYCSEAWPGLCVKKPITLRLELSYGLQTSTVKACLEFGKVLDWLWFGVTCCWQSFAQNLVGYAESWLVRIHLH